MARACFCLSVELAQQVNLKTTGSSTCPGVWLARLELPGSWPVVRIVGPDVLEIDCMDYLLPAIGKFKNWK
jgi:hypothetical protein